MTICTINSSSGKMIHSRYIKVLCPYILNYCKCGAKWFSVVSSKQDEAFVKTDLNLKIGKKYTVDTLGKLLSVKKIHAFFIASKYKTLCQTPSQLLTSNYHLYKSKNISTEAILECPYLLAEKYAPKKIAALEKVNLSLDHTCPLIKIDLNRLQQFLFAGESDCRDRIVYMSHLFEKPIRTICVYLADKKFLWHINLDKLTENFAVLKELRITEEEITKDLWVLRYNTDVIRERLENTRNRDIERIKTWMVRAPPNIVDRYVKRRCDNKLILGNHSLAEYLSERLECSVQEANYIISKHPALENKSLKKTQEIIDFLYSYGFKPFHLCRVPKILLHSVETTRKRLEELKAQGLELDSLYILTKSKKQYMQYYELLVKSNKKKCKN